MNDRNMFYQNVNQGYSAPGAFIPPSGYNINSQYQAYGPNVIPDNYNQNYYNQNQNQNILKNKTVKNLGSCKAKILKFQDEKSVRNITVEQKKLIIAYAIGFLQDKDIGENQFQLFT